MRLFGHNFNQDYFFELQRDEDSHTVSGGFGQIAHDTLPDHNRKISLVEARRCQLVFKVIRDLQQEPTGCPGVMLSHSFGGNREVNENSLPA
jgi:hypothetical protein